jgi:hypothetical protein
MTRDEAYEIFSDIFEYYDSIDSPVYRNAELQEFKGKYAILINLKNYLGVDKVYVNLVNAMSQVIARLEKRDNLSKMPTGKIWSNLSERGMNKVIPPIYKKKHTTFPVEWTDKWGNMCYVSNGYWSSKNYRVLDVLGYMFLLKEGGDALPKDTGPIFNDLYDVMDREDQLNIPNNSATDIKNSASDIQIQQISDRIYSIGFTDKDFRKCTDLRLSSADILNLLLETSRVEFKLSFPVRLKSTGHKENIHRMNYFSRFFELSYEDIKVRTDGVVRQRRYRIFFNTLLGELFVNNLKAKHNDPIDLKFYTLPDSAQIFYRRILIHNNFTEIERYPETIAEAVGLQDANVANLTRTIENNILDPLKEYGYIKSYEKTDGIAGPKYIISRETDKNDRSK